MLGFTKFNIGGLEFTDYKLLGGMFKKHLELIGVVCNVIILTDGFALSEVEKGKCFKSKEMNIIPMKPGDPRIVKQGRNHLESFRLTKEQYDGLVDVINLYFTKMGISCLIEFQEFSDDPNSKYVLVENKKIIGKLPVPGSFTIKKGA